MNYINIFKYLIGSDNTIFKKIKIIKKITIRVRQIREHNCFMTNTLKIIYSN